ncbi:MAG: hypothetical protein U1E78_11955 [Gammaproteobacteria bacterium]
MEDSARLLSRLNPLAVDWNNVSAVTGEILTATDIAAALAGLARGPYLLMLYLWCHDHTVESELMHHLIEAAKEIAVRYGWQCKDDIKKLKALVILALDELKNVNLCKSCKGTGIKINQPCDKCTGGVKRRPDSYFATHCQVSPSNWQKCCESKYQSIYLFISDWNDLALQYMRRRI